MSEGVTRREFLRNSTIVAAGSVLAAAGVPATAAASPPQKNKEGLTPVPEYTVFCWLNGDGDTQKEAELYFNTLQQPGAPLSSNVIAVIDRLKGKSEYTYVQGPKDSYQEQLEEIDMGSGAEFERLLARALKENPSEKRVVTLTGHGSGWLGLSHDSTSKNKLHALDLAQALKRASPGKPIDLLVLDSCTGGNIDLLKSLIGVADYAVANEGYGWMNATAASFNGLVEDLRSNPQINSRKLGENFLNNVKAYPNRPHSDVLVNINALGPVDKAIQDFADVYLTSIGQNSDLRKVFIDARRTATHTDIPYYVDIWDMMEELGKRNLPESVRQAIEKVQKQVKNPEVILAHKIPQNNFGLNGLSIFCPTSGTDRKIYAKYDEVVNKGEPTAWSKLLGETVAKAPLVELVDETGQDFSAETLWVYEDAKGNAIVDDNGNPVRVRFGQRGAGVYRLDTQNRYDPVSGTVYTGRYIEDVRGFSKSDSPTMPMQFFDGTCRLFFPNVNGVRSIGQDSDWQAPYLQAVKIILKEKSS